MRLLFADDHVMIRDGLRPFLLELDPATKIFEAGNFCEVLDLLESVPDLQLVVLDLRMPGMDAMKGIRVIRERHAHLPVALLSSVTERKVILEALALGVAGFIPKRLSAQAMISALRLIVAGERYVPASLFDDPVHSGFTTSAVPPRNGTDGSDPTLTLREREILDLLREGLPNKLIARRLNVSEVTVKSHLCHVFRKLGVQNRVQAARYCMGD
ncbi:MAG TPA: response regulator transcription factor [Azospirillum sp.]